jgi:hypothetical protein
LNQTICPRLGRWRLARCPNRRNVGSMGGKPRKSRLAAEREYWLATPDRSRRTVRLSFEEPVQDSGGSYSCTMRIEGLESPSAIERRMCGADAVQALYIAMQNAWMVLALSRAYKEGRLTLDGSQHLGLPIVETISEHDNQTSWARVGIGRPEPRLTKPLADAMRTHLVTYPDEDLLLEVQELAARGHSSFPFSSDQAAISFRDEVRRLGFDCDLWIPPTPALL